MKSENFVTLKKIKTKSDNEIELIGLSSDEEKFSHCPLVIGVFHGDEPQGKYLIEEYLKNLSGEPPLPCPPPRGGREYKKCQYSRFSLIKAKELRKNCTDAEKIMWEILRAKNLFGLKFRRQQPIGKYVVDFVCFDKKLIIELDGGQHGEEQNRLKDDERTKYLEHLGYKVLRFWNNDVLHNIDGVTDVILSSVFVGEYVRWAENSSLPPLRGRVRERGILFIPCLNPDGMAQNTRTNANGVDLNRNFPTKNWGEDTSTAGENPSDYFGGKSPASEIETQFVIDVIEKYNPFVILTLHAPYKVVNYDGPAREISEEISKIIGYPVEESIGYPTPGSFGTYAGVERNIPVITLELDEKISVEELSRPIFEIFEML